MQVRMAAAVALLRGLISGSTAAAAAVNRKQREKQQQQQKDEVYVHLRLLFPLLHEATADIARGVAATISHRRPSVSDAQLRAQTLNPKP